MLRMEHSSMQQMDMFRSLPSLTAETDQHPFVQNLPFNSGPGTSPLTLSAGGGSKEPSQDISEPEKDERGTRDSP